jgi:adenylate kinase family enzyme/inosine/xanthosine triphosphate pyrophosphatase family protein
MLELIFFSTNQIKIAHLQYIGKKFGIKIKSFKEVNYYASYNEPKIDDREELLRLSYLSALKQWKRRRNTSSNDLNTFFFEDTSVRIEALSSSQEIPGVNVKFWMQEMTFQKLDSLLKANGNNRNATVRSDMILHLPYRWRELLGTSHGYLWVHGEVEGAIANEEIQIQQNLVYPWLDNKTFNRWFVPNGASLPVSALDISDANKYDFRARAFSNIVDILNKLQLIQTEYQGTTFNKETTNNLFQLDLPRLQTPPTVFVICGATCAGKTTTAAWLTDTYSIPHLEASDFMYCAFWVRHGLRSSIKIGDFAAAALLTQPDIVATPIADHILTTKYNSVIVTGFRSNKEIDIFKNILHHTLKVEVIFLEAEYEIRLNRAIKRNRDEITPIKFEIRNKQEEDMGLQKIKENSVTISNNLSPENLFSDIKKKYSHTFKLTEFLPPTIAPATGLEQYILMTLYELTNWKTTTEIATKINDLYKNGKNKNNVSRYFNQGFHPYYEVRVRTKGNKKTNTLEYKLSATGISLAKLLKKIHANHNTKRKDTTKRSEKDEQLDFFPS